MNVYTVREQGMWYINIFATKKHAIQHLHRYGYRLMADTDMYEIWDRGLDPSQAAYSRAYLECKPLIGAEHNYKHECKQLRATVRHLHETIRHLRHQVSALEELITAYEKEG